MDLRTRDMNVYLGGQALTILHVDRIRGHWAFVLFILALTGFMPPPMNLAAFRAR